MVVTIRSAVAQAERMRILDHTNEGRKRGGNKFGCRRSVDRRIVQALHQKGIGATEIARQPGIARFAVYKNLEGEKVA